MSTPLFFASSRGEIFDKNYEKTDKKIGELPHFPLVPLGPIKFCDSNNSNLKRKELQKEKDNYTFSLYNWSESIYKKNKYVILPIQLSLNTYIPIYSKPKKRRSFFVTKKIDFNQPPPPSLFLPLYNFFISDRSLDFKEKRITDKSENNEEVPLKLLCRNVPNFGAKLIPQEPIPELYESFDSYKKSLQNWCKVEEVSDEECKHPKDFANINGFIGFQNRKKKKDDNLSRSSSRDTYSFCKLRRFHDRDKSSNKGKSSAASRFFHPVINEYFENNKEVKSNIIAKSSSAFKNIFDTVRFFSIPIRTPKKIGFSIADKIINDFEQGIADEKNNEFSDIVRTMHLYNEVSDTIIKNSLNDSNVALRELALKYLLAKSNDDYSTNIFESIVSLVSNLTYSNEHRCAVFRIIVDVLVNLTQFPIMSLLLFQPKVASNATELFVCYGGLKFKPQRFDIYDNNSLENQYDLLDDSFKNLCEFLFALQLLKVMSKFFKRLEDKKKNKQSNKNYSYLYLNRYRLIKKKRRYPKVDRSQSIYSEIFEQIKHQKSAIIKSSKAILSSEYELIYKELNRSPHIHLHFAVVNLLIKFLPYHLLELFNKFNSGLFLWMIKNPEITYFGEMSSNIIESATYFSYQDTCLDLNSNTPQQFVIFSEYFIIDFIKAINEFLNHANKQNIHSLTSGCYVLAFLIYIDKLAVYTVETITEFYRAIMNLYAAKIIQQDALYDILSAVCCIYRRMIRRNRGMYLPMSDILLTSIAPALSNLNFIFLDSFYKMQYYIPTQFSESIFQTFFVPKLSTSINEEADIAWKVFRLNPAVFPRFKPAKFFLNHSILKSLCHVAKMHLLLFLNGYTDDLKPKENHKGNTFRIFQNTDSPSMLLEDFKKKNDEYKNLWKWKGLYNAIYISYRL